MTYQADVARAMHVIPLPIGIGLVYGGGTVGLMGVIAKTVSSLLS